MTRAIRLLHLRRLRRQPLRSALALVAISAGISMTVAVAVARTSFHRSLASFRTDLTGAATLQVTGPIGRGGLDDRVVTRVAAVPGVRTAAPVIVAVTQVAATDGRDLLVAAVGADCRSLALFDGAPTCDPTAIARARDTDPPLVSAVLARRVGDQAVLRTDVGDRSLRHAPRIEALDRINAGMVAVYPLPVAQRLFGRPGAIDSVLVVPAPGVDDEVLRDRLVAAVGSHNVVTSSTAYSSGSAAPTLLPFLLLLSLFGLTVGGQLVYNVMTLSLEERRRELAVTSALGGTPRLVVGGVLAEAALLGLAGGALGVLLGIAAARPFIDNLSRFTEIEAGLHLRTHLSGSVVALGLGLGALAAMAAALLPARRAARLDVAGELAERDRHTEAQPATSIRRLALWGGIVVAGTLTGWAGQRDGSIERWQPAAALAGLVVGSNAIFRLPSLLAPPLFRGAARRARRASGPSRVALTNLVAEPRRTGAVLTAVAAAVGTATVLGSLLPAMRVGAGDLAEHTAAGRVWVSTLRPNNTTNIDAKLTPAQIERLARLPGVDRVERTYDAFIEHPRLGRVGLASGDGRPTVFPVLRGVGQATAARHGRVMIGPGLARVEGLRPGDRFTVPGRRGDVTLTVGGIWAAPDYLGRSITLPLPLFHRIAGERPATVVLLVPRAGTRPDELAARVRAAGLDDRLLAYAPDELATELAQDFRTFLAPFWVLQRGLLGVSFMATVSTLLLAAIQRRREHGLLAALGMPPGDLGRMVLAEAGMIGLAGTALGGLAGASTLRLFSFAAPVVTGLTIPYRFDPAPLAIYGVLATACVLAGAALPAWRTSRLDPVVALRYE